MSYPLEPLTFPLQGIRLIEASAGTGKTYMIAALYLRLVLGHGGAAGFGRPLMPPEILVVTFTNAATQELRDRIRSRLTQAAAFFQELHAGDDYLQELRAHYPKSSWAANARLLHQAAQWMDESAIYTIHAWCQRMLRQHAFESGSLFDLELVVDDEPLLEEAACDYWRCYLYPQSAQCLGPLLKLVGCPTPQDLLAQVRPLLAMGAHLSQCLPAAPQNPFALMDLRAQAIEDARKAWASDFDAAVDRLRQAQADKSLNGNKYRTTSLQGWLEEVSQWVHNSGPLPDDKVLAKFCSAGLAAGTAKKRSAPEHPAYAAFDRLIEQLNGLDIKSALFDHAAHYILRRLRKEKQRLSVMGFDDLLTHLNDALQSPANPKLAQVIGEQFPVVLIDEFQDTDPVQYAIFRKIYHGRAGTGLLMIGDPKQAIYAFRGADINTYLSARKDTDDSHFSMGTNYRSSSAVVQAVNRMFAAAADYAEGAFFFKDQIPFQAVSAQGRKEQLVIAGDAVDGITFWRMPQDQPVSKTGDVGYLEHMAAAAASEIVRWLSLAGQQPPQAGFQEAGVPLKPLCPADIAVLVRDGQEAAAIRRALDARRVRSVYLSDKDFVFDTPEAESVLYLLQACAQPEQERLVKAALAAVVLQLPLSWLDKLNQDELAWDAEVERFRRYQRMWQRQGVLPMLRALLHDFNVPARLLSIPGGERALTNLLHLSELLQEAAARLDGEHALIRWLAERIDGRGSGSGSDSQEYVLRLESDDQLVRVVTIHKSKGLEYPLVLLPFISTCRPVTEKNCTVAKYHDEQGRLVLKQKPDAADIAAAERERLAEDLRLLYVAVTRAQHACWLGVGVIGRAGGKDESGRLHLSGLGYLLSGGELLCCSQLAECLAALKGDCQHIVIAPLPRAADTVYQPPADQIQLAPAAIFAGHVARNWFITSYSGILAGAHMAAHGLEQTGPAPIPDGSAESTAPDSATQDQLQEAGSEISEEPQPLGGTRSIHLFPRGPFPGTFLHGLLEWTAGQGFAALAGDRARIEDRLTVLCRRRNWDDWVTVLTDWLHRLLQIPLKLPQGQGALALAGLARGAYQSELEFLFAAQRVDTRVLDGAISAAVQPQAVRPQLRSSDINGMLKGYIDLVFCHDGRYYVLDYKSNYLGDSEQAYQSAAMEQAMLGHRYDLQYVLYVLALHRLLKARLPDYDYQRDMGGVIYLFLRGVNAAGQGVYTDKPAQELVENLDRYFAGRSNCPEAPHAA